MRLRAFKDPEVWIDGLSTKKQKARDLVGRRVIVPGYGEGTVVAYKGSKVTSAYLGKGSHVIEFDVGGSQNIRLDYKKIDFRISSEIFVQEYIDAETIMFDEEADGVRKKVEKETSSQAMKQSGAWVSPGNLAAEDPEHLVGKIIDLGKGKKGPVTDFRKGKHLVSLENKETGKTKSHAMNLEKLKIKMLSDDYVHMYAGPIIQDTMHRWADGQLEKIQFEREEIAAQDELEMEALMKLYLQQQRKQATADAAVAADHMFYTHIQAFKSFSADFLPTVDAMDPELIEQAGGITAVLRQTWVTMPRLERSMYEDAQRKLIGDVQWIPIPSFDEVEPDRDWLRAIKKTPLRGGYQMDTEKVGNLEVGQEVEVLRTKEIKASKEERKLAKKEGRTIVSIQRIKTKLGWCSFNKEDGTPLLEKYKRKEPSYVKRKLPLRYIDVVSSVRLTITEQEDMCKELIPEYEVAEGARGNLYERDEVRSMLLYAVLCCFMLFFNAVSTVSRCLMLFNAVFMLFLCCFYAVLHFSFCFLLFSMQEPECECEVFARWLVGDSEIAEKVRVR